MSQADQTAPVFSEGLSLLQPVIGQWTGTSNGVSGTARVERVAEHALNGHFIRVATRSVSERDVHEDIGFFSYDNDRQTVVFREFHNEAYVIKYVLTSAEDGVLSFESEHIENPYEPTLRARTVIHLGTPMVEVLELGTKEEPLAVCVTVNLDRKDIPPGRKRRLPLGASG